MGPCSRVALLTGRAWGAVRAEDGAWTSCQVPAGGSACGAGAAERFGVPPVVWAGPSTTNKKGNQRPTTLGTTMATGGGRGGSTACRCCGDDEALHGYQAPRREMG